MNHRFSFYFYKAEYYDENGELTETFERKEKNWVTGNEFLKEKNYDDFDKYFKMDNLSLLINKYFEKSNEIEKIKEIIYSYLTIKEIKIFEPQYLLSYFLLEGISKLIVMPTSYISSEELIKEASIKSEIDIRKYNFKISRNRLNDQNSKLEWEISEYRNKLTHFNNDEFNKDEIYDEFVKMMKLARKLIISYIEPSLSDWPEP